MTAPTAEDALAEKEQGHEERDEQDREQARHDARRRS